MLIRAAAALAVTLLVAGCGSAGFHVAASRPASPEQTVRRYLVALNDRDAKRVCTVVAPYMREQCGEAVDAVDRRVTIAALEPARTQGRLTVVWLHYRAGGRHVWSAPVYLARFDGEWRVADWTGTLWAPNRRTYVPPPPHVDVWMQAYKMRQAHEKAASDAFHMPTGSRCDGNGQRHPDPVGDGRAGVDLLGVSVHPSKGWLCIEFELASAPRAEFQIRIGLQSVSGRAEVIGPSTFLYAARRADGKWRIATEFDKYPAGEVGVDGNVVSVRVKAADVYALPALAQFAWYADVTDHGAGFDRIERDIYPDGVPVPPPPPPPITPPNPVPPPPPLEQRPSGCPDPCVK